MKTFDLNKSKIEFEKGEVQKNIQTLYKHYGDHFYIQYKKIKLPVFLYEYKYTNKTLKTYIMNYATKSPINLYPFRITFNNFLNISNKNSVYINQINKIDTNDYPDENLVSGSEMIEFVLEILKKLYVEKAYLNDGATIKCEGQELSLSLFKLIEKRRTFYMKFGFKPEIGLYQKYRITNMNAFDKILDKSIKKIINYKISDIQKYCKKIIDIITQIYKKNDFKNAEIFLYEGKYQESKIESSEKITKFSEKLNQMIKLINILPKSGTLGPWLKKTFYKNCNDYNNFLDIMVNSNLRIIKYKNKFYKNPLDHDFELIDFYTNCNFVINLTKFYGS